MVATGISSILAALLLSFNMYALPMTGVIIAFNLSPMAVYDIETTAEETTPKPDLTFRDEDGNVLLDSDEIAKVKSIEFYGGYAIELEFSEEGKKIFAEITENMIGRQLSVYYGEVLLSSPTVQSAIAEEKAVITGLESRASADALAEAINSMR